MMVTVLVVIVKVILQSLMVWMTKKMARWITMKRWTMVCIWLSASS